MNFAPLIMRSIVYLSILATSFNHAQSAIAYTALDEATTAITISLPLQEDEYVYKDYINLSIDNPEVTLSSWKSKEEPTTQYDPSFKENKKVYKKSVTLSLQATKQNGWKENETAQLHLSYYVNSKKAITEEIIPLTPIKGKTPELACAVDVQESETTQISEPTTAASPARACKVVSSPSLYDRISTLAQKTDSLWLRLLMVLILGMLLSLTPCIYPMIPITVGILQSRGSKSLFSNFLISCAYVAGIATTFALLGLMAAFTGQIFGSIMSNPFVILTIVALLMYVAFSMFGFYEMYIPKSLQNNNASIQSGSLLSIFLFGAVSGSVASPCLSPGLILLLSIVTTLGSKLLGFVLLFTFGLGLGLPLIIIGTFSSSLNMLPRAGMWMVEIKKLSGLLLLGMCFYFLKTILPLTLLLWGFAFFMIFAGIWLLYDVRNTPSKSWKTVKNIAGVLSIAGSVVVMAQAYKSAHVIRVCDESNLWQDNYETAIEKAKQTNKKIFVDVGAPFCSICSAIDATVFKDPKVVCALQECYTVKIDGSNTSDSAVQELQQRYTIIGFPTFLLIDPATGTLIKRWGSEIYEMQYVDFANELELLLAE